MNFGSSKRSDPHRLLLNLLDKADLKRSDKYVARSNLKKKSHTKNSYKNNKFKISFPTWNKKLELPDGPYSVSDIQGYF